MSKQRKQDKTPVESTSVRPGSLQEHDQHQSIVSMKQLEEQERELRTIVDSMPQLIAVVDQNERYRFVNAAYAAQWNCSHREIVGHTVLDIVGETIYAEIRPHLELGLGGEQHRYEFKSQLPNSDEEGVKEVTFTPQRNEQGDVVSVHLVSNHIAHSKRNERQSRFRADLFRQINKLTSSTEIMTLATKAVREFFNASRCILFVVDNHDDTVAVLNETKEAT
ncbi:MAG: PAS domain S-box-containing protein, partial [Mariniblastus sp.]